MASTCNENLKFRKCIIRKLNAKLLETLILMYSNDLENTFISISS